jgi:hypothetical protein
MNRYVDVLKSFGAKPEEYDGASWRGPWRHFIFHPVWSYAWRAQEELDYLKYSQQELDIVREAVGRGAWTHLQARQSELRDNYRRPSADWRFYLSLPMHDRINLIVGDRPVAPNCPYPDFTRAWLATSRNLSQHEMLITTIALKRYQLRHGKMPGELNALVPDYLKAVPRDLVDGQPLRYRLNADGSFILYSIGEDARDDGGDSRPGENSRKQYWDFGSSRDWVWPQTAGSGHRTRPDTRTL